MLDSVKERAYMSSYGHTWVAPIIIPDGQIGKYDMRAMTGFASFYGFIPIINCAVKIDRLFNISVSR